jgi:hypothetical protein
MDLNLHLAKFNTSYRHHSKVALYLYRIIKLPCPPVPFALTERLLKCKGGPVLNKVPRHKDVNGEWRCKFTHY